MSLNGLLVTDGEPTPPSDVKDIKSLREILRFDLRLSRSSSGTDGGSSSRDK